MRLLRIVIFVGVVLLVTGCQAAQSSAAQPIPTLFPTSTPMNMTLENAERIARQFLQAWENSDFDSMYNLLSFASQDSTTREAFVTRYTDTHRIISLEDLEFKPRTIDRDQGNARVALFLYDALFRTRLLGPFTDSGRILRVVYEERSGAWRVAWTPGTLFPELDQGGQLRMETLPVNRGNIYDRNGVVLADQEHRVVEVNVIRRSIPDEAACLDTLGTASNLPTDLLRVRLNAFAQDWVNKIADIEPQAYVAWEAQLITDCDATFGNRPARRYPNGQLAPHILGSVGYLNEDDIEAAQAAGFPQDAILGQSGIEESQDEILRGQPGARLVIESPSGGRLRTVASMPSQPAESVWLSIDSDLQQQVVDIFSQAYADNASGWADQSRGAAAVVMDVHTGEILAMVSWPTYDGNAFTPFPLIGRETANDIIEKTGSDERLPLLNRVTQGRYPSGSIMKIASALAVLDSGIYTEANRFTCIGSWTREGITLTDWFPAGHGTINTSSAVTQSCNPFFYEVGLQMNARDPYMLPQYLRQMGLGVSTGMTDIREDPGAIGDPDSLRIKFGNTWTFADAARMAIGQGEVEITPLQFVRLTAAVANGGSLYQPQLVRQTGLFDDFTYLMQPNKMASIEIDDEALRIVRAGMCNVTTTPAGTATHIFRDSRLLEVGVCGKTGTAQDLTRFDSRPHAWFTAYAPSESPEIAITVVVENVGDGSAFAAPITRQILEYYFFGIDVLADAGTNPEVLP